MRIGVLGAGIMGSSLALLLARRGVSVTLFDSAREPMTGASRWNEGKIHLGYVYAADPSLSSARRVLSGGLTFAPLISSILEADIAGLATDADDIFLVHRASVVDADAFGAMVDAVDDLIRSHPGAPDYFHDLRAVRSHRMEAGEIADIADPGEIAAGFRVPERSVRTDRLAGLYADALASASGVTFRSGFTVTAAHPEAVDAGRWQVDGVVDGAAETVSGFDYVINALWHGRLPIDVTAGLVPAGGWSNRYRVSLFATTDRPVDVPSAFVCVGAFGDVKNYDGRSFYLSWYPAGLLAESEAVSPPAPPVLDDVRRREIIVGVRKGLESVMPPVSRIFDAFDTVRVEGGYVFAQGRGSISEAGSTLHLRDKFGIARKGHYISVDTGKFSSAPELADILVRELCG